MINAPSKKPISQLREYWRLYGGAKAILGSRYFYAACILTALCYGRWSSGGWWQDVLAVVPSLLGFSVGAFTLFVGFGTETFRRFIVQTNAGSGSVYMGSVANFLHFIVVQLLALMFALLSQAAYLVPEPDWIGCARDIYEYAVLASYGICYLAFIYACLLAVAASMGVFRVARWFDTFDRNQPDPQ